MFKEIWFRSLSKEDKDNLSRALNSSLLADRLREIIVEWEREVVVNKSDYDSPAWSHKQAHLNGMSEILTRFKSIMTPDQRK